MYELRRLRLLHELSLRGTLAAVADALSYSPSTISSQLSVLEREAGVPLLEPDGRRVRLTPAGQVLAAHAARVLALEESVRAELAAVRPGLATVRLAVIQSVAQSIVPRALTLLREREPGLRVEIAQVPPEEGLFELTARTFDLVVAEQYPGHTRAHAEGIERHPLGADPIRLALSRDDPARQLGDLRDRAWVLEPAGTAARAWAVQQCRAAGFEPDVRYELADLTSHVRLVAAGHAVGLIPDLVWAGQPPPVRLLPLPGENVRDLFLATRTSSAGRTDLAAVGRALSDALAELGRQ